MPRGPYTIVEVGKNSYEVESETGRRHHASIDRIQPIELEPEEHVEIKQVLSHRKGPQLLEYLVEWEGYPIEKATWVHETDFDTTECINEYWESLEDGRALGDQGASKRRM